jgi:hypothetical protein
MTDISKRLRVSLPIVSVAVQKGEKLIRDEGLELDEWLNVKM